MKTNWWILHCQLVLTVSLLLTLAKRSCVLRSVCIYFLLLTLNFIILKLIYHEKVDYHLINGTVYWLIWPYNFIWQPQLFLCSLVCYNLVITFGEIKQTERFRFIVFCGSISNTTSKSRITIYFLTAFIFRMFVHIRLLLVILQ